MMPSPLPKSLFYIHSNTSRIDNINRSGPVIFEKLFDGKVYQRPEEDTMEGPFSSISELKKYSSIFKEIEKDNPSLANKIIKNKILVKDTLKVRRDYSPEFKNQVAFFTDHILRGSVSNNTAYGGHYFHSTNIRIKSRKAANISGVFSAHIEILNPSSGKWVEKKTESTFFPISWSLSKIVEEIEYAWTRRIQETPTKYRGVTKLGVTIHFITEANGITFKTIYPKY